MKKPTRATNTVKLQKHRQQQKWIQMKKMPVPVRRMSESSIYATEEDEDDAGRKIELGPQYTLKEQFEKDKVCFCMCLFLSLIK